MLESSDAADELRDRRGETRRPLVSCDRAVKDPRSPFDEAVVVLDGTRFRFAGLMRLASDSLTSADLPFSDSLAIVLDDCDRVKAVLAGRALPTA